MTGEKAMLLCVYCPNSAQRPATASLCAVILRMDLSLPEQAPCLLTSRGLWSENVIVRIPR